MMPCPQERPAQADYRERRSARGHSPANCADRYTSVHHPVADMAVRTAISREVSEGTSQHSDDSHDDVRLNFGNNLATAMFVRKRGRGVVRCSVQFCRVSRLDFVAKRSPLTIGDGRNAW